MTCPFCDALMAQLRRLAETEYPAARFYGQAVRDTSVELDVQNLVAAMLDLIGRDTKPATGAGVEAEQRPRPNARSAAGRGR